MEGMHNKMDCHNPVHTKAAVLHSAIASSHQRITFNHFSFCCKIFISNTTTNIMMSRRKLTTMARKWQRLAGIGKKGISVSTTNKHKDLESSISPFVADKGHFVVYTTDWKRFEIPLSYLGNDIFRHLLKISEEEFGVSSDGRIILPCDSIFMQHVLLLIRRGITKDSQKALINSVTTRRCSSSASLKNHGHASQHQMYLCGY